MVESFYSLIIWSSLQLTKKKLVRVLNEFTASPFNTTHSMALVYTKNKTQELKTKVVVDHLLAQLGQ